MASLYGHTAIVDILVKAGVDVNQASTEVILLLFDKSIITDSLCCVHVISTFEHVRVSSRKTLLRGKHLLSATEYSNNIIIRHITVL